MILRQQKPENLEVHTPNAEFYVRSHFDFPRLDGSWRLQLVAVVTADRAR